MIGNLMAFDKIKIVLNKKKYFKNCPNPIVVINYGRYRYIYTIYRSCIFIIYGNGGEV